jgi:hypothetical protein
VTPAVAHPGEYRANARGHGPQDRAGARRLGEPHGAFNAGCAGRARGARGAEKGFCLPRSTSALCPPAKPSARAARSAIGHENISFAVDRDAFRPGIFARPRRENMPLRHQFALRRNFHHAESALVVRIGDVRVVRRVENDVVRPIKTHVATGVTRVRLQRMNRNARGKTLITAW